MKCKILKNIKFNDIETKLNDFFSTENVKEIKNIQSNFSDTSGKTFVNLNDKIDYSFIIIYE